MITTNAEFDAKNAMLAKKPIYVLKIATGAPTYYTTHDLAAEGVTGGPAHSPWLKTPHGAKQSIDVLNGTSTIGELDCEVVDQAGAVRTLVGSTTLAGLDATLSVGYPGMAFANFVALHTYQLVQATPSRGYTSWHFRSRDRQMNAKRTIYNHPENGLRINESNPWIVQGTPAEIAQAMYLFGLGRPVADIDRTALASLDAASEGLFNAVRPFLFRLTQPVEVKQFLESEIYKPCGLYPVINHLGQLSLRAFRPPAAGPAGVFTFNDDNCTVLPDIERHEIVNEFVWKFDDEDGETKTEVIFVDATSISTYGRARQHVIESRGLRTNLGAWWVAEEVSARLARRFAGTPTSLRGGAPIARIEAFLLTLPVWAGDYVLLTNAKMPNLLTGALGVTNRLYEVIDREPDYASGRMRYRLLDTGLTGLAAAKKWSPSAGNFIIGTSAIY